MFIVSIGFAEVKLYIYATHRLHEALVDFEDDLKEDFVHVLVIVLQCSAAIVGRGIKMHVETTLMESMRKCP